ncbi:type II toxin-antitoxin system VapC family toxin [Variovorax sp. RCC_210]|uniref:type II toxin-antitoxin system VapC family toxin n=1 Tax=Variovorax sp. RCC_210 TaxID=3239217 RepID=UPI003524616B
MRLFVFLAWDVHAALRHGDLRAQLKAGGTPIGDFDEMIAAHALAIGAVIVMDRTKHFARVLGVVLITGFVRRPSAEPAPSEWALAGLAPDYFEAHGVHERKNDAR